jgi:hypothetical protein
MNAMPIVAPRYEEEDWLKWKALCTDEMCATWEDWHTGFNSFLRDAAKNRATVHEVTIRPHAFQEWAGTNEKPLDGFSRGEYAGWLLKDRFLEPPELPKELPTQAEVNRLLRKALKANPDLNLSDISAPYLRRPEAAICPVFRENEAGELEQFGSGVLVCIADQHFLVSAAHVFDSFRSYSILIPGREHLIEISGEYSVTPLPEDGMRENDEIDIGYFHFKGGLESELHASLLFLDGADCNATDFTQDGDAYTVIGYPAERSESIGGKAATEMTRISCSGVMDHRYEKLGIRSDTHLLLQYRMKKGVSARTLIPGAKFDFEGVSGGGVFA